MFGRPTLAKIFIGIGAVALVVFLGVVSSRELRRVNVAKNIKAPILPTLETPPSAKKSPEVSGVIESVGTLPEYSGEPIASLTADPSFLKQISEATYKKSLDELAALAVTIAVNPGEVDAWMQAAYIKRFYNDYRGVSDIYEYVNRIAPTYTLAFYNLAVLYGYYVHEPQKAIGKFHEAIRLDPVNVSFYIGLAEFYKAINKLNEAEEILRAGESKVPADPAYLATLGSVYKAKGDIAASIRYYERALQVGGLGESQSAVITAELERLRQTP